METESIYVVWKSRGGMCWELFDNPNKAKATVDDVLKRMNAGENGTRIFWIVTGQALTTLELDKLCEAFDLLDKEAKC